jgi:transcriptional regulator with XRE-family HTH domain
MKTGEGPEIYAWLGKRVREERLAAGLTQAEMARLARLTPGFIGYVERGERKASIETVGRICAALKITPGKLMGAGGPRATPADARARRAARLLANLSAGDRVLVLRLLSSLSRMRA